MPGIWPGLSIPIPYGSTPLFESLKAEKRLLTSMPSCLFTWPNLTFRLQNYDPVTFYGAHEQFEALASGVWLGMRRFAEDECFSVRLANVARGIKSRGNARVLRQVRHEYETNRHLNDFYRGTRTDIPKVYETQYRLKLGRFSQVMPDISRLRPVC